MGGRYLSRSRLQPAIDRPAHDPATTHLYGRDRDLSQGDCNNVTYPFGCRISAGGRCLVSSFFDNWIGSSARQLASDRRSKLVRFDPDSGHGLDGHACDHHEKQYAEFSPVTQEFLFPSLNPLTFETARG